MVKLEKGEFVGRAALAHLSQVPPARRLVGFQMVDNAVPRQGYRIELTGTAVGEVTSGTFSPTLKRNLGMAYVPVEFSEPGSAVDVVVRGQPAGRPSSPCRTTPTALADRRVPIDQPDGWRRTTSMKECR